MMQWMTRVARFLRVMLLMTFALSLPAEAQDASRSAKNSSIS